MGMVAQGCAAVMAFAKKGERKNKPENDGLLLNKRNDAERVYPYFQCAF
jgi:hypothetical protein